MINKMIDVTERRVQEYADKLLVEEVPAVQATLNSLVAVGQKLVGLYYDLLEVSDIVESEDYNFLINEIKREEVNFITLQGVYAKLISSSKGAN